MVACGYRTMVRAPDAWRGRNVRLHVGAADHEATVYVDGRGEVARAEIASGGDFTATLLLAIPVERWRNGSPADPFLYDLALELIAADGALIDRVTSYSDEAISDSPMHLLSTQHSEPSIPAFSRQHSTEVQP